MVFTFIISCKSSDNQIDEQLLKQTADTSALVKDLVDINWLKNEEGTIVIPWDILMKVKLVDTMDEKLGGPVAMPIWNDTLRSLENKDVIIEGFYIPVDETGKSDIVVLSAYPFSQCFFCGKAGIESIVDVLPKDKLPTMKVDSKVKFKGKFKLNPKNYDFLIYILDGAELVK